MQAMVDKIEKDQTNSISFEANTKDGVQVTVGKSWSNGWGLFGYGRAKSKKDAEAGVKAEFKW